MVRRVLLLGVLALVVYAAPLVLESTEVAVAATVPPGFTDQKVTGVVAPTAVAFTPDGRMLVTTQRGQMYAYKDGSPGATPTLALNLGSGVCTNSERGLLGVAVDPEFATNGYVYLYYTANKAGTCVNRVERFTLSGGNTAASSKVLLDNIPSPAGNHNAGDVRFGKDGYLYVSVGDGGCDYAGNSGCAGANDAALDPHVLLGKILRVTRDGGAPSTNPYASTGNTCALSGRTTAGKQCKETFASGLRNPFRFAFDPNASGTRFFINDVGQSAYEEIDEGKAGANYGWNVCEGLHDNPNRAGAVNCATAYTPPVHEYPRSVGTSITGGAFVPNGVWPSSYDDSYLFGDFVSGKIFKLNRGSAGGYTRSEFVTGLGGSSAVAMAFGPSNAGGQALYYTSYANGGEVHRISYNGTPTASVTADPTYGAIPLAVNFDGSGSRDPNNDALTYLWDFGDGATAETTTPTTSHAYDTAKNHTATLKVRDATGVTSAPATVTIDAGNTRPEPKIEAPAVADTFGVGQEITLTGSATDPEDGALTESSLSWEVVRHHDASHTHPFSSGTGNNVKFAAPPPEDLSATGNGNHLEIRLTATDSRGLKQTVSQELQPKRVEVSFDTSPTGLEVTANGEKVVAPKTLTSWEGYELNVDAPEQVDGAGRLQGFVSWSDGGAASHSITTPAAAASYTATFEELPARATTFGALSSSETVTAYNETPTISGKLSAPNGPVVGKTVTLWRSTDGGATWTEDAAATYDSSAGSYKATAKPMTKNALFQMRFAGDPAYTASTSANLAVKSGAYLSRPVTPVSVKKNVFFNTYGYLAPAHTGKTRLEYYRYSGGKWRLYGAVQAANSPYNAQTRYNAPIRLPYAGSWYVRAVHEDADHARTVSPLRTFKVY